MASRETAKIVFTEQREIGVQATRGCRVHRLWLSERQANANLLGSSGLHSISSMRFLTRLMVPHETRYAGFVLPAYTPSGGGDNDRIIDVGVRLWKEVRFSDSKSTGAVVSREHSLFNVAAVFSTALCTNPPYRNPADADHTSRCLLYLVLREDCFQR
jgi:hypothetical protein